VICLRCCPNEISSLQQLSRHGRATNWTVLAVAVELGGLMAGQTKTQQLRELRRQRIAADLAGTICLAEGLHVSTP
jgi:hypothetical protein